MTNSSDYPTVTEHPPGHPRHKRRLTGRNAGYTAALLSGVAVFASGTATSFDNLSRYAREHGWIWGPALPLGLDLGIFALLLLDWLRPSVFLRSAAWTLTAGTVAANFAVTKGDAVDRSLHAIVILVAVIIFEAARHLRDDQSRMDKIRLSRWVLSPVRTARLWRRMVLWEVTSYAEALRRESVILHARTVLAAHYDQGSWRGARKRVPLTLKHQLATGQIPAPVLHGLDLQAAVRDWVHTSLGELAQQQAANPAHAAGSAADAAEDPAAADRRRWDLIWDLRDRLLPEGVPARVFALAYALARDHFEQVGTHIKVADLMDALSIGKPRATKISQVLRSSHTDGPDLGYRGEDPAAAVDTPEPGVPDLGLSLIGPAGFGEGLAVPSANGRGGGGV
jgi:hypothetical protein